MSTRILWTSSRSQLACAEHVPPVASSAWWSGEWHPLGENEQIGYQEARGRPAECAACLALAEMTATQLDQRDQIVAQLARSLGVTHLEPRGNDGLDFYDVNVELLRSALEFAYDAGRTSALPGMGAIG